MVPLGRSGTSPKQHLEKTMEFKAGDVVVLKSSGPEMTITSIQGEDANCAWFVGTDGPRFGTFVMIALKRVRGAS